MYGTTFLSPDGSPHLEDRAVTVVHAPHYASVIGISYGICGDVTGNKAQ